MAKVDWELDDVIDLTAEEEGGAGGFGDIPPEEDPDFNSAFAASGGNTVALRGLRSSNYKEGNTGWKLNTNGGAEFSSLKVKGVLYTIGTNDDIQTAIDKVAAAGGGTVRLPAGTFYPTADITGYSSVSLVGSGRDLTIIDFNNGAYGIKYHGDSTTYKQSFEISNLTVKDSEDSVAGISIKYSAYWSIDNIRVTGSGNTGLYLGAVSYFRVENSYFDSNSAGGLYCSGEAVGVGQGSAYFTITNCFAKSNLGSGFEFFSDSSTAKCSFFSLNNCVSNNNSDHGYKFSGDTEFQSYISGCSSTSVADSCFDINGFGLTFVGCHANEGNYGFYIYTHAYDVKLLACSAYQNTTNDFKNLSFDLVAIGCNLHTYGLSPSLSLGGIGDMKIIGNTRAYATDEINTFFGTNNTGSTIGIGEVVVYSPAASGHEIARTTTQGDDFVCGVAQTSMTDTVTGVVRTSGKINNLKVNGTSAIAIGDFLGTYTTAGIAMKAAAGDMAFAIALEAYSTADSSGVIDALLISPRKI